MIFVNILLVVIGIFVMRPLLTKPKELLWDPIVFFVSHIWKHIGIYCLVAIFPLLLLLALVDYLFNLEIDEKLGQQHFYSSLKRNLGLRKR